MTEDMHARLQLQPRLLCRQRAPQRFAVQSSALLGHKQRGVGPDRGTALQLWFDIAGNAAGDADMRPAPALAPTHQRA